MTPCHRNRNPQYHLWTPVVPKVPANCQLDKGKITIDKEPCQLQIKYWKTDQIRRAKIKDALTTTINAMENQEEYDKEVQELYDWI